MTDNAAGRRRTTLLAVAAVAAAGVTVAVIAFLFFFQHERQSIDRLLGRVDVAVEAGRFATAVGLLENAVVRYPDRDELAERLVEVGKARAEQERQESKARSERRERDRAELSERLDELATRVEEVYRSTSGARVTERDLRSAITAAMERNRTEPAATRRRMAAASEDYPAEFQDAFEAGVAALEAEQIERARRELERAVALEPNHPAANASLAASLYPRAIDKPERERVIRHARRAIDADPTQTLAHLTMARTYIQDGDRTLAAEAYGDAVRADPGNISARYELGRLLLEQDQTEQALEQFRQVLDRDASHLNARYYAARALADLGRSAAALDELSTVREAAPSNVAAHTLAARLYSELDDHEAAIAAYGAALDVRSDWHFHLGMARSYEALSRLREARAAYTRAAQANPASTEAERAEAVAIYRHLAKLYADTDTDAGAANALRAAEDGLEIDPSDPVLLRLAGRAAMHIGRSRLGEEYLRRAEEEARVQ